LSDENGLRLQMAMVALAFCFLFFSSLSAAQVSSIELTIAESEYSLGENITVQASLTPSTYVTFEVNDAGGNPVLLLTNLTDDKGSTNITFNLGESADIGDYTIYASASIYGSNLAGDISMQISYPSPITFSGSDITFSTLNPIAGQAVQIYAVMHNSGDGSAAGLVRFYDGDTSTPIGDIQTVWLPPSGSNIASVGWTPATDAVHTIIVSVDCGPNYKEHSVTTEIAVGGATQPNLVLTTGDINIYRFRPGETRTLSVDVTCYGMTINNVHLACLDDQNLTVDTSITPPRTMSDGDTIPFYLRVQVPENLTNDAVEFQIILQVKGNQAYSNAEHLDIVVTESALSFFMGNIAYIGAAVGIGISAAGFGIARNESWKYFLFSVMLAPMYVKLKKSKVLDHFVRGQIFGHIKTNPGAHYNEIKEVLGVANGVLAHHLRTLEREEFIKSRKEGNLKRFYPMDMNIEVDKHGIQLSQAQIEIINILKQNSGISQSDIARRLNKDRRAIAYHIKEMERMNMVRLERNGRETNCYLGDVEILPPPEDAAN